MKYIWIFIWIVWTVLSIMELIKNIRCYRKYGFPLSAAVKDSPQFMIWILTHMVASFVISMLAFLIDKGMVVK